MFSRFQWRCRLWRCLALAHCSLWSCIHDDTSHDLYFVICIRLLFTLQAALSLNVFKSEISDHVTVLHRAADFPQIFSSHHLHLRNTSSFLSWVSPSHRLIGYFYFIPPPCFLILSHSLFICLCRSQLHVRFRSDETSPGMCTASDSITTSNTRSTSLPVSLSL